MKFTPRVFILAALLPGTFALAQTVTDIAPANIGGSLLTLQGDSASGMETTSLILGANGRTLALDSDGMAGMDGAFAYEMTGPAGATLQMPGAAGGMQDTTLAFTSETGGIYTRTSGGTTTQGTFELTRLPWAPSLANVAVRTTLERSMPTIVGFVVAGTMPRRVLVRAIGPGLSNFDVDGAAMNPTFTIYDGSRAVATNNDWGTAATMPDSNSSAGDDNDGHVTTELATADMFTELGAFALTTGSRDAATVVSLHPGAYTVLVTDQHDDDDDESEGPGEVLIEVYFVD